MGRILVWAAGLAVASLGGPWAPAVSAQGSVIPVFCVNPPTDPVEPGATVAICVKGFAPASRIEVSLLTAESTLPAAERAGLPATIALTSPSTSVTNTRGELTFESMVPELPAASYRVRAAQTSNCGSAPCPETAQDFRLAIKAKLTLSSAEAAAGSTLTLTGQGFAPGARAILDIGAEQPTLVPRITNAKGTIVATFTMPEVSTGPNVVRLYTGPSCSGSRCASARVTVTTSSTTTTTSTTRPSTTTTTSSTTIPTTTTTTGGGDGDGNGTAIFVAVISSVAVIVAAVISGLLARGRSAGQDRAGGTG